jgi:hypothetical protein
MDNKVPDPVKAPLAPDCDKCGKTMGQVTAMPTMKFDGKITRVFWCAGCDRSKWVCE